MGSVSSYLTRHCPCPVLICKLDPSEIEARKELDSKKQASFAEVFGKYIVGVYVNLILILLQQMPSMLKSNSLLL